MTETFVWKPDYSVGVATLDEQHRRLVALIGELQDALARGDAQQYIDEVFLELVAYTQYHFAAEERLMEQHRVPGLAEHRAEHESLTRRVLDFKQQYEQGRVTIPVSLLFALQSWLKHHILGTDQRYGEFLNARGVY